MIFRCSEAEGDLVTHAMQRTGEGKVHVLDTLDKTACGRSTDNMVRGQVEGDDHPALCGQCQNQQD